ncbi:hypothetical protein CVT26_001130 [Gymnopilus dilepis]|uniref:XPG-I domain-containing protein n=1 Tax=Gymnopilus dilepis TaxID=231916 RepID=A0A409WBF2_9AGAR|nr:hypothetical protein CVT26_001130 [Gymnopilus dilepis]
MDSTHDKSLMPPRDSQGRPTISIDEYVACLNTVRKKDPLRQACIDINQPVPKSAKLEQLRAALVNHWFPQGDSDSDESPLPYRKPSAKEARTLAGELDDEVDLLEEFGVDGDNGEEILGFDDEELDDDLEEDMVFLTIEDYASDHGQGFGEGRRGNESHEDFKKRIRVEETKRAEQNRRAGGIKTQNAMVKAWKEFCTKALANGQIKDEIIDEHHLLLYIRFCSERPKRTKKGVDIPGTFIGASHIKKLYFGALRIRKEQEARDPTLSARRPATSVHVWDSLRGRMNEASQRTRDGLVPAEDAPDIIANTFLASITDEQMAEVGKGFLTHRELRSVIFGHLCWTAQHATFLHPNQETAIQSVLGLQGEEKAGARKGLKTKINPVYTVFIAHRDPMMDPLGAFLFYHHYIHDVANLTEAMGVDWSVNKSWRGVRILHSRKAFTTPYHEQSLYNLYVKAFKKAGFVSRLKAHLPRHILGYQQEKMEYLYHIWSHICPLTSVIRRVDASVTSRMGWVCGETYFDTYAPALPKEGILGAHGYKSHEVYDPVWRHVHVPEQFLQLVCPMAEGIYEEIVGKANLSGAANYWSMIMTMRPYLFQCAAAIFQICPESALFRLPALDNPDVKNWMKSSFPTDFTLLKAKEGSPVDLQRLQNQVLQQSLEEMRSLLSTQTAELTKLRQTLERRTAVLSPTKAYSNQVYQDRSNNVKGSLDLAAQQFPKPVFLVEVSNSLLSDEEMHDDITCLPQTPVRPPARLLEAGGTLISSDDSGVYLADDEGSMRAFANPSPRASAQKREKTSVDLVSPPTDAFSEPGGPQLLWPPILGQRSVTWEQVFDLIKRPELLWECWSPSKTLNGYTIREQWACWTVGEAVFDSDGAQTGVKPPIQLIEKYFRDKWRKGSSSGARKSWERFREVPEWICSESERREISPSDVIHELEALGDNDVKLKGLSALTKYIKKLREDLVKDKDNILTTEPPMQSSSSSTETDQSGSGESKKRKSPVDVRKKGKKSRKMHRRYFSRWCERPIPWRITGRSQHKVLKIPAAFVCVYDGAGRPDEKRGVMVIKRTPFWEKPSKELARLYGYHVHEAPGEAEAELAILNIYGFIDAVITSDSDILVFGALNVYRTIPSEKKDFDDEFLTYNSDNLAQQPVGLTRSGLILFALLTGRDYDKGVKNFGPAFAHGLARCGFGEQLIDAIQTLDEDAYAKFLIEWRINLKRELTDNPRRLLPRREPSLARALPESFPDRRILNLYLNPVSSWNPPRNIPSVWDPQEPSISEHFWTSALRMDGWRRTQEKILQHSVRRSLPPDDLFSECLLALLGL